MRQNDLIVRVLLAVIAALLSSITVMGVQFTKDIRDILQHHEARLDKLEVTIYGEP